MMVVLAQLEKRINEAINRAASLEGKRILFIKLPIFNSLKIPEDKKF